MMNYLILNRSLGIYFMLCDLLTNVFIPPGCNQCLVEAGFYAILNQVQDDGTSVAPSLSLWDESKGVFIGVNT